jgi:hypothetical protein
MKRTEGAGNTAFDQCFVETASPGAPFWYLATQVLGNAPCPSSTVVSVTGTVATQALATAGGHVRFRFDSGTTVNNDYFGWGVDNVLVDVPPVPGVVRLGVGCPGSGGFSPESTAVGGAPSVGNASFGVGLWRGPGGAPAQLFLGVAAIPSGIPLGGCALQLDPAAPLLAVGPLILLPGGGPGGGTVAVPLGVPNLPSLSGQTVFVQWSVLDPGSGNGAFTLSDALQITFS